MDVFPPQNHPGFVSDATNRIIDPHFEQTPRPAIKTERRKNIERPTKSI